MKNVQQPRGTTVQEDAVVGLQGQLRVDTSRREIRLHDGATPGGVRLPNYDTVVQLISTGASGAVGVTNFYPDEATLAASVPVANTISFVTQVGFEDAWTWHSGAATQGDLASSTSGYWRRLDSASGFLVRLWRAGLINLQVGGAQPATLMDTTPWLTGSVGMLWNGTTYVVSTPVLFARLMAYVGGYYTGAVGLPTRIGITETQVVDLNTALDAGWWKSSSTAANAPVSGVHSFEHRQIDATNAVQIFYVQGSATRDVWIRFEVASVWGSWVLAATVLPGRLSTTGITSSDANTNVDFGQYYLLAAASNVPVAENGVLIVEKYDANNVHQMWSSIAADKIWTRRYTGGVWQTWQQIYPMDVPMGLAINNATAKSAPVNADKFPFWDSVSGLLREWTYGNMLTALNALYQSGSAALTALTTLGTGANGYLKNTGGTYSWATPGSDIQTFNASGTWTKPSGAYTLAQIEVWGPGGSGGAGGTDAGGGGGGGYSLITIPLTLLGATETVTVGTGGAAKAATGVGNPGSGNSSLGTWVIAGPGLAGGETLGAGIGVAGGTGGTGFTETGGQGAGANSSDSGIYFGSATVRGAANGGGSSKAGSVNALLSATTPINLPAIYGGQGGNGATGANGTAGSAPGGGGGACSSGTSGAGANGRVRITCY